MRRWWNDAVGRLLMHLSVVLERMVASDEVSSRWKGRRNAALYGAHRRGVTVEELAVRLGLTQGWVRRKIAEGKAAAEPPAVEEAA